MRAFFSRSAIASALAAVGLAGVLVASPGVANGLGTPVVVFGHPPNAADDGLRRSFDMSPFRGAKTGCLSRVRFSGGHGLWSCGFGLAYYDVGAGEPARRRERPSITYGAPFNPPPFNPPPAW